MVSVVLPVYNCPTYVGAAIESILNQTYEDFELLIIDDGSTDDTPQVLSQYRDPRIRHVRHENRGLAATLNVGIELARGKYIARQDQDDLSLPDRLEKQLAFMEANPECGLLGTWAQIMEADRLVERFHRHPTENEELLFQLLFNNPFVHSSVMLRLSAMVEVGGYSTDPSRQPPEDYELWSRISRVASVANLPDVLLHYREIPSSMSRQGPSPFLSRLVKLSAENLAFRAGRPFDDATCLQIAALTHNAYDMISHPNFNDMRRVLNATSENIYGNKRSSEVREKTEFRIRNLQAAYLVGCSPAGELILQSNILRKALKKILAIFWKGKSICHAV